MSIFENEPLFEKKAKAKAHGYFQKLAPKLHFLIHIDVLMLCRKFELIPTNIFQVMSIYKNEPISEKYPVL